MPGKQENLEVRIPPTTLTDQDRARSYVYQDQPSEFVRPRLEDARSRRPSERALSQGIPLQPNPAGQPIIPGPAFRPASSTATSFAQATKVAIKALGDFCWCCNRESEPLPVCHVIEGRDRHYLDEWRAKGLVHLERLSHKGNGIVLCSICHHFFDNPQAHWLLLPIKLEYFIDAEQRDFNRRKRHLERTRQLLKRESPTAEQYRQYLYEIELVSPDDTGGLYCCWVVRRFQAGDGRVFDLGDNGSHPWHGDPMASIRKSLMAPAEILYDAPEELQRILKLYHDHDKDLERLDALLRSRAPPSTHRRPSPDDDDDDDDDDGGYGDKPANKSSAYGRQPQMSKPLALRRSTRVETIQQAGRRQLKILTPLMELVTSRKPRSRPQGLSYKQLSNNKRLKIPTPPTEYFEHGPEATSQDHIEWVMFFSGLDKDGRGEDLVEMEDALSIDVDE